MSFFEEFFLKANLFSKTSKKSLLLKNRSWLVIPNNFHLEKLIFGKDKNLVLVSNGLVVRGEWEYISQDGSLLIEFNEEVHIYDCYFLQKDIVCLINQVNHLVLFIIGISNIPKGNLESFLKKVFHEKMNTRTATLDNGKVLNILNADVNKKRELIGKNVLMDFEFVEDGIYYKNNGKVEFHVLNSKLVNIKYKN